ncbi:MAG TPA: hypothetical protein VEL03_00020 [Streptosporangiaceae bacterium]|nr:hypothetical protein [Streptosporangiaceae bacterium]
MASKDAPHVDMQSLNDTSADIYEAIATLEYAGRRPTRGEIAATTALPEPVLDDSLAEMTSRGLLVMSDDGAGEVYLPARRSWSAAPDKATGQKLS